MANIVRKHQSGNRELPCTAASSESCPIRDESGNQVPHFAGTAEEVKQQIEDYHAAENDPFASHKKSAKKTSEQSPAVSRKDADSTPLSAAKAPTDLDDEKKLGVAEAELKMLMGERKNTKSYYYDHPLREHHINAERGLRNRINEIKARIRARVNTPENEKKALDIINENFNEGPRPNEVVAKDFLRAFEKGRYRSINPDLKNRTNAAVDVLWGSYSNGKAALTTAKQILDSMGVEYDKHVIESELAIWHDARQSES